MHRRTKILIGGAVIAALAGGGVAIGAGSDDAEPPITGDALQRATAAALEFTGEGEVTETEVGDEDSYYEVEVTLDDGRRVDVQLDEDFNVVGDSFDDDEDDENDENGDD